MSEGALKKGEEWGNQGNHAVGLFQHAAKEKMGRIVRWRRCLTRGKIGEVRQIGARLSKKRGGYKQCAIACGENHVWLGGAKKK